MASRRTAFGYLRVSSSGQVKGHGFTRQRTTIRAFARREGIRLVGEFRDHHTGTEADRPGFTDMLAVMLGNGVRIVVVESLDRFARDVLIQGMLLARLKDHGITLLSAATGEDVTASMASDPMREAMVLMQSVFSQTEKKLLVRKLAKARKAKREETGRCEGRKPYGFKPEEYEVCERIWKLRRRRPSRPQRPQREPMSFAKIAKVLAGEGIQSRYGKPFSASTIRSVVSNAKKIRAFQRFGDRITGDGSGIKVTPPE